MSADAEAIVRRLHGAAEYRREFGPAEAADIFVQAADEIERLTKAREVLIGFAHHWLAIGSDDAQLVQAHDFFTGVAYPPNLENAPRESSTGSQK